MISRFALALASLLAVLALMAIPSSANTPPTYCEPELELTQAPHYCPTTTTTAPTTTVPETTTTTTAPPVVITVPVVQPVFIPVAPPAVPVRVAPITTG